MGNVFLINWTFSDNWLKDLECLKEKGFQTVAMALKEDSLSMDDLRPKPEEKVALIMGNEGAGLREETRRFVLALRLLELDVDSETFDFIGLQTTLINYAAQTGISQTLLTKLQSVLEELFQVIILQSRVKNKMKISVECSDRSDALSGRVLCTGPEIDMDDPRQFISWQIIRKRAKSITVEPISEDQMTNLIRFELNCN